MNSEENERNYHWNNYFYICARQRAKSFRIWVNNKKKVYYFSLSEFRCFGTPKLEILCVIWKS